MFMKELRSKSCKDGRMQIESYYYYPGGKPSPPPTTLHDLRRCYSSNHHVGSSKTNPNQAPHDPNREVRMKKSKGSKNWSLSDPEVQRMRRVASYRAYDVEGKVRGSLKKGLRWIKNTCNHVVYGYP